MGDKEILEHLDSFLSLEDRLLRIFGGSKIQDFMQNQLLDDLPLESELLTKSLDSAQKRVEEDRL